MNGEQRLVFFDAFPNLLDAGKADREVDGVIGGLAAAAEKERNAADCFGIHRLDFAGCLGRERSNDRGAMHFAELLQSRGVPVLRIDQ